MPTLEASYLRQIQALLVLLRQIRVSYALFHVKQRPASTVSRSPRPARACARGSA